MRFKVAELFAGIGGFSVGLEATGEFKTVAFVERDKHCQQVLKKNHPGVTVYNDVRDVSAGDFSEANILTAGFPCQDVSLSGKLRGLKDGTRTGLWSEIPRIARDLRPEYIILENVTNLLAGPSEQRGGWFGRILGDLAAIGYDAEWHCIRAFRAGLPQIRDRVWALAYPQGKHVEQVVQEGALPREFGRARAYGRGFNPGRELHQPALVSVDDGLPVTAQPYKQYGNAIVPQIAEIIGRSILKAERIEP